MPQGGEQEQARANEQSEQYRDADGQWKPKADLFAKFEQMNLPAEYDGLYDPQSNFGYSVMREWYERKAAVADKGHRHVLAPREQGKLWRCALCDLAELPSWWAGYEQGVKDAS